MELPAASDVLSGPRLPRPPVRQARQQRRHLRAGGGVARRGLQGGERGSERAGRIPVNYKLLYSERFKIYP